MAERSKGTAKGANEQRRTSHIEVYIAHKVEQRTIANVTRTPNVSIQKPLPTDTNLVPRIESRID